MTRWASRPGSLHCSDVRGCRDRVRFERPNPNVCSPGTDPRSVVGRSFVLRAQKVSDGQSCSLLLLPNLKNMLVPA